MAFPKLHAFLGLLRKYWRSKMQASLPTPDAGEMVLGFKSGDSKLYKRTSAGADTAFIEEGDTRLTDARTPTAHTHTASEVTDFNSAARAQVEAELVAGANITLTPSGSGATRQITIASTGGGANQAEVIGLIIALG